MLWEMTSSISSFRVLLSYFQGIDGRSQMGSNFPRHVSTGAHEWGHVLMCPETMVGEMGGIL
jgi:hypothetical protein